jgi:hypothetical protein
VEPKGDCFAATPLGDVRIDACEVRSAEGKRRLFLAIDRVTTFAYTFATHLKTLRWRTPFQAVRDARSSDPQPFRRDQHHLIPEPNNYSRGGCSVAEVVQWASERSVPGRSVERCRL